MTVARLLTLNLFKLLSCADVVGVVKNILFLLQLTKFCHTGNLEVFHNVMLKYVPKRVSFSYEGMVARSMLAALDNNLNAGRSQAHTKAGQPRWKMQWSKASKTYVVKKISASKDYSFRLDLVNHVLERAEEGNSIIELANLSYAATRFQKLPVVSRTNKVCR